MNKKLFAFDMDGTIVDLESKPRPETLKALREAREKGHLLAVATGRPFSDIVSCLPEEAFDYIMANNGSYFYDVVKSEFVYAGIVPTNIALEMVEIGKKHDSFYAVHAQKRATRVLLGDASSMVDPQNDPNFTKFIWNTEEEVKEIIKKYDVTQSSLRSDKKTVRELAEYFRNKYGDLIEAHIANDIYLDLNPKGVNKAKGIENILERANIKMKDVVAFGDSGNDVEMLIAAGVGVAMGNGNARAKEVANVTIGNHDTDAIADKIRELI